MQAYFICSWYLMTGSENFCSDLQISLGTFWEQPRRNKKYPMRCISNHLLSTISYFNKEHRWRSTKHIFSEEDWIICATEMPHERRRTWRTGFTPCHHHHRQFLFSEDRDQTCQFQLYQVPVAPRGLERRWLVSSFSSYIIFSFSFFASCM